MLNLQKVLCLTLFNLYERRGIQLSLICGMMGERGGMKLNYF